MKKMVLSFKDRTFDEPSRILLKEICFDEGLDIGCADRPISELAKTVDIIPDYNPTYLSDMHNLPIGDDSQDFLVASHVLEHTENTIGCLKEWKRLLKKDGRLGISVPNGELCNSKNLGDGMMFHRTLFTAKTLHLFLEHVGFREVKVNEIKLKGVDKTEILAFAIK